MMDPSGHYFIPLFIEIGRLVQEKKIFQGVLLYMVMVGILAMWQGQFEQTFVPLSQDGFTYSLTSTGPVVNKFTFSIQKH